MCFQSWFLLMGLHMAEVDFILLKMNTRVGLCVVWCPGYPEHASKRGRSDGLIYPVDCVNSLRGPPFSISRKNEITKQGDKKKKLIFSSFKSVGFDFISHDTTV